MMKYLYEKRKELPHTLGEMVEIFSKGEIKTSKLRNVDDNTLSILFWNVLRNLHMGLGRISEQSYHWSFVLRKADPELAPWLEDEI